MKKRLLRLKKHYTPCLTRANQASQVTPAIQTAFLFTGGNRCALHQWLVA